MRSEIASREIEWISTGVDLMRVALRSVIRPGSFRGVGKITGSRSRDRTVRNRIAGAGRAGELVTLQKAERICGTNGMILNRLTRGTRTQQAVASCG